MLNTILSTLASNFTNLSTAQSVYLALVAMQIALTAPYLIWMYQSKTGLAVLVRNARYTAYQRFTGKAVWKLVARFGGCMVISLGSLLLIHWYAALMVSTLCCVVSIAHMGYTLGRLAKEPVEEARDVSVLTVA
jgi:VIT1/CCC1 family predicted Fe2+/Mn2+ transporter